MLGDGIEQLHVSGEVRESVYRRMYRLYEGMEQRLGFLRSPADTWFFVFRKNAQDQ
jgi:hypothetical protein